MNHASDRDEPAATAAPPAALLTRRGVLLGAAGIIAAAGAGAGVAGLRARPAPVRPAQPPAVLVQALAAERDLIAAIAATRAAHPELGSVLTQLAGDHTDHERAFEAMLSSYPQAVLPAAASAHPGTRASLRAMEQRAATAAAARAGSLRGAEATLLASIAACEASHAHLLGS